MSTEIESLELKISSNAEQAAKGIDALTQSLTKLKNATKDKIGLPTLASDIKDVADATQKASTSTIQATKSFTDLYTKLSVVARGFKKVASAIYSCIEKSMDYTENMNLFNVSMGEYAGGAHAYAEQVRDAMGIDTSEWTRAQGIFMTMAKGFGIAGDRAHTMSKNLTQLGYDLSSFYNMDFETAMLKLKSGLAGELEPLRAIGYDLSQAKLEATALELGITKSVSAMTQAEKAQLRYYAIMTQVTDAHGDMARTLKDPANQMRVFKAEISMAAREIGNIFIPALTSILPYAIAVTRVIGSLASTIAGLFGYEGESGSEATDKVVEGTGEVTDNLSDAQDEAKKLKSYLLGFDELNIINPNTEEDTSGWVDFELPEYDFMKDLAESKVATIVEEMEEWLGLTKEIDTWAELFDTKLGKILETVGLIGLGFGAWKIGTGLYSAIAGLAGASSSLSAALTGVGTAIGAISAPVWIVIGAIAALVIGLGWVYFTNEEVRKSVNDAVADIKESFIPLMEFITETIIPDLKDGWNELVDIFHPFGDWLSMVFTSIWTDMIIPALEWLGEKVIPKLTETISNLWNDVIVPWATFLGSILRPAIEDISFVLTVLWENVIVPLADFIGGVYAAVWESAVKIFNKKVIPAVSDVISKLQFLWDYVLSPIVDYVRTNFEPVFKAAFESIGDKIKAFKKILTGLIDFVTGVFTGDWEQAWEGLSTFFQGVWDNLVISISTPLNLIIAKIEGFINSIIDGWNAVLRAMNALKISIPEWLGGGSFGGFNFTLASNVTLRRFAEGGFPTEGEMFIAREAGPEMVGSIGRRTAVANNDQIVSGIAGGVAEANEEQNELLREQNSLLRALLEKDNSVRIDGRTLTNSVEKYQRERGRVLITGGVL